MVGVRRLAWLSLVLAFGHIVFGAIVRITGSGMGCGDHWPRCRGQWIPPLDRPDLIIEVSHRYLAATLTTAILMLVLLAWRRRRVPGIGGGGGVLRPAGLAAGLVVSAALFGAFTVWLELANKLVIVTHLGIAMMLLGTLAVAIIRAGGPPRIPSYASTPSFAQPSERASHPVSAWSASAATARHTAIIALLTFMALVLGALTAHVPGANSACTGFPLCSGSILPTQASQYLQFVHRLIAFALFGYLGWLGVWLTRRGERRMAALARVALTVLFVQLVVAAAMVEFRLPALLRSLHEAFGTLFWIVSFMIAYVARRLAPVPGRDAAAAAPASPLPAARARA
jgi:heme A synthase